MCWIPESGGEREREIEKERGREREREVSCKSKICSWSDESMWRRDRQDDVMP